MNEQELIRKVTEILNQSTQELNPRTLLRLSQAREQALKAYRTSSAPALAGAGGVFARLPELFMSPARAGMAAAFVAALAWGWLSWQNQMHQPQSLDLALLTDELPLNVYAQQDFKRCIDDPSC